MKPFANRDFEIVQPSPLLEFLLSALKGQNRTTVKSLLAHQQICINGRICTQFDAPLKAGDKVTVCFDKHNRPFRHPLLEIVFEDAYLIVVHKKAGLLSMANERVKEKTAYRILSDYVKQSNPRNLIFILHRLDRETSGLMMFAKSREIQEKLQSNWDRAIVERKYVAVVEGTLSPSQGTLKSYLSEDKNYFIRTSDAQNGKLAVTHYHVLKSNRQYSLVELDLETGRKNQIRVHMQSLGHPICGDKKYGARTNPIHRLALHARKLHFIHPGTQQDMDFETPIPKAFTLLVKNSVPRL